MNVKLNLLENSKDYLINAIELFHVADEYGVYQKDIATIENKTKYKLAFGICMNTWNSCDLRC